MRQCDKGQMKTVARFYNSIITKEMLTNVYPTVIHNQLVSVTVSIRGIVKKIRIKRESM